MNSPSLLSLSKRNLRSDSLRSPRTRNYAAFGIIYPVVTWRKGSRLRLVPEAQAEGETAEALRDIREALGLPELHLFYPALAAYPAFLKLHWELIRPVVASAEFFACAERLRADSYTRTHNYFRICPLAPNAPAGHDIAAAVDFFHYKDPLLLLLFCLQAQALEGPVGQQKHATPALPPPTHEAPAMVPEENPPVLVRRTFQEVRRTFDYPYVSAEFQALARWPDFLRAYWSMLKQKLVESPLYDECRYALRATAWALAAELPGPVELTLDQLAESGLPQDDIASIGRILDLFVRTLSSSLINVSAAKIALEGGSAMASMVSEPHPHRGVA